MIAGVIFAVLLFTALAILKWNDKRKGISSQSLSEEGQFEELLNPGATKKGSSCMTVGIRSRHNLI